MLDAQISGWLKGSPPPPKTKKKKGRKWKKREREREIKGWDTRVPTVYIISTCSLAQIIPSIPTVTVNALGNGRRNILCEIAMPVPP